MIEFNTTFGAAPNLFQIYLTKKLEQLLASALTTRELQLHATLAPPKSDDSEDIWN